MKKLSIAKLTTGTCAALALFAFAADPAIAAKFKLDSGGIAEAVELGKSKFDQDQTAFRFAYINNLGYGYPHILLRTEYLAIADYVRRSEYQRGYGSQKVHKLNDTRIENARREVDGQLQFVVKVYGPDNDFMKGYNFHLMAGDKKVDATFVDRPVTAEQSGFKGKLAYVAQIIIDFPTTGLNGDETVSLILDPPDGLGPSGSRNAHFEAKFDLSAVK